jgi:hypothetical protein
MAINVIDCHAGFVGYDFVLVRMIYTIKQKNCLACISHLAIGTLDEQLVVGVS